MIRFIIAFIMSGALMALVSYNHNIDWISWGTGVVQLVMSVIIQRTWES